MLFVARQPGQVFEVWLEMLARRIDGSRYGGLQVGQQPVLRVVDVNRGYPDDVTTRRTGPLGHLLDKHRLARATRAGDQQRAGGPVAAYLLDLVVDRRFLAPRDVAGRRTVIGHAHGVPPIVRATELMISSKTPS
jgi:hypothetical protein